MATLVCNYLRHQGLTVVEGPIWQGGKLLRTLRPRLYFSVSAIGGQVNFETMRYAFRRKIPGVTLVAEGNFSEFGDLDVFIWGCGNNPDRVIYEQKQLMWSRRTRNLFLRDYPQWSDRLYVSGAVGFDAYRVAELEPRAVVLGRHGLERFQRVVGYGCWDFGTSYPADYRHPVARERLGDDQLEWFRREGKRSNEVLRELITTNPDTLFLLKEHPGRQLGALASGIEGLAGLDNTLVIHREEGIASCIAISDVWFSFESTTAIEAWLLGKPTGLINPGGTDFPRATLFKGSPNFPSVGHLQAGLDQYWRDGSLPGFADLEAERDRIVEDTIQWADGLNHVRAGNEIIDMLEGLERTASFPSFFRDRFLLREKLRWWLSVLPLHPKSKKYRRVSRAFSEAEVACFAVERLGHQTKFYHRLGLDRAALLDIRGFSPTPEST